MNIPVKLPNGMWTLAKGILNPAALAYWNSLATQQDKRYNP